MKSVDTGYIAPVLGNPLREGNYLIYAETFPWGDGTYGASLFIERVADDGGESQIALSKRQLAARHASEGLAGMSAISYGQHIVRVGEVQ